MPFAIPTLPDLTNRAREAFRAYVPGSDAWSWPNNIYAMAKVIGGVVYEVFGFADYIQKQKFALTADSDSLDLHGAEYGMARKPADPAGGMITLTVTDDTVVAPGAVFTRVDGVRYTSLAGGGIIGPGTLNVQVVAMSDGKATNSNTGQSLTVTSGVVVKDNSPVLVQVSGDGIIGGADVEPDGDPFTFDLGTWRGRILFRKRFPPHGGAAHDYVQWATEVSGVTRVYVERLWGGPGTVRVFCLMDDLYVNGIPTVGDIDRVRVHIEPLRPSVAVPTYAAPVPHPIDVTVHALTPDTTDTRSAVLLELQSAFRRLSAVSGSDVVVPSMPFLATPQSWSWEWVWQAVANAKGVQRAKVTLPTDDVALAQGEIAVLGTVTFT